MGACTATNRRVETACVRAYLAASEALHYRRKSASAPRFAFTCGECACVCALLGGELVCAGRTVIVGLCVCETGGMTGAVVSLRCCGARTSPESSTLALLMCGVGGGVQ